MLRTRTQVAALAVCLAAGTAVAGVAISQNSHPPVGAGLTVRAGNSPSSPAGRHGNDARPAPSGLASSVLRSAARRPGQARGTPGPPAGAGSGPAPSASPSPAAGGGAPPGNIINATTSSQCLDANSNSYGLNGDRLQLWSCNTHPEQIWAFLFGGTANTGHITSANGLCLDADSNDYPNDGDHLQLWSCNNNPEQIWGFRLIPGSAQVGQFYNASHPGMCVDADSNDYPANGDPVQLWACANNSRQDWRL